MPFEGFLSRHSQHIAAWHWDTAIQHKPHHYCHCLWTMLPQEIEYELGAVFLAILLRLHIFMQSLSFTILVTVPLGVDSVIAGVGIARVLSFQHVMLIGKESCAKVKV